MNGRRKTDRPTYILTADECARLVPCRSCGRRPNSAPLGEWCPASDPEDPCLHDFAPLTLDEKLAMLQARTEKAMAMASLLVAEMYEDEAQDRMQHAEWSADA